MNLAEFGSERLYSFVHGFETTWWREDVLPMVEARLIFLTERVLEPKKEDSVDEIDRRRGEIRALRWFIGLKDKALTQLEENRLTHVDEN